MRNLTVLIPGLLWLLLMPAMAAAENFDLVISGGRVMDPETRFDQIANVGIRDGVIVEISGSELSGAVEIDAHGMVVAPGFIDLHAHGQNIESQELQVFDGVTTILDQEKGVYPVKAFYDAGEGHSRLNFGASVSHEEIRIKVKTGIDVGHMATADPGLRTSIMKKKAQWAEAALDESELNAMLDYFRQGLAEGGLGLGLAIEYVPGASRDEIYQIMKEAARMDVPTFVHVRAAHHPNTGGLFEMMQEMLANAAVTGGSLHICHVTSKGLNDTALILDAIEQATISGLDVSVEAYPYTAGSTSIGSSLFNPGWRERWGVDYGAIEWPATGERLTEATFESYRAEQPAAYIVFHMIPEAAMRLAVASPIVMIASDGVPLANGKGHPRLAGSYSRVLGRFVRDEGLLTLMTALKKMTLLPALRMQQLSTAFERKGRMQKGMDADIVVFDPVTIRDRATFKQPNLRSEGMRYVIVNGTPVVAGGELQQGAWPGKGLFRAVD